MDVSSTLPTQEGVLPTVTWDITVNSKRAKSVNGWIYFIDPQQSIVVEELVLTSDNSVITPVNGFYYIGDISRNSSKKFAVTASYNDCNLSDLTVYTGSNCEGYPTDLASFPCAYEEATLYLNPQPSELQVRFYCSSYERDACDNSIKLEVEL